MKKSSKWVVLEVQLSLLHGPHLLRLFQLSSFSIFFPSSSSVPGPLYFHYYYFII